MWSARVEPCPFASVLRTERDTLRTGATRLELATSGVTGRRSNQLSYAPGEPAGLPARYA